MQVPREACKRKEQQLAQLTSRLDDLRARTVQHWGTAGQLGWEHAYLEVLGPGQACARASEAAESWCTWLLRAYEAAKGQSPAAEGQVGV